MVRTLVVAIGLACAGLGASVAGAQNVAVLTPYLSAVATNDMVTTFQAEAEGRGWSVQTVDTAGDFGALANRLEDVINAKVDAIVVASINPAQVQDQISKAAAAGIPVFAIDGAQGDGVTLNVTSDNYVLGSTMTEFLMGQIGDKGKVVRFFHSAHPGVRQREMALEDYLKKHPDVSLVGEHYVQVPGQIEDSRNAMDAMLLANSGDGAIDAVWAAWDEPGIGAQLAIEAADRKGIVIAGIDGNAQALELIKGCTPFVGTVAQNFKAMSEITAQQMEMVLKGGSVEAPEMYAPVSLITRESLGVSCN